MPPIDQDKFPAAISKEMRLDVTAAEGFNLQAWHLAVREWHPFYKPFIAALAGLSEEDKLKLSKVMVSGVSSSDKLDEGTQFSLRLTLLSPEAISLVVQALATREILGG